MQENIISWNMTNWVSVGIMGLGFFFVLGLIQKAAAKKMGSVANA